MKRWMKSVVVGAVAAVVVGQGAAAQAADGTAPAPPVGGGGVTPPGQAVAMTQQAKDKVASTEAWAAAAEAGDLVAAARAQAAYEQKYGGPGIGSVPFRATESASSTDLTTAAFPTSRSLGVTQVGQKNGYYCGPASGFEIIRYLHGAGFTSRYDGTSLTQTGLANSRHMNTDATHVTDWSSGRWTLGVNRWRGSNWYVQVHAPSASLLKGVAQQSIGGNGMPFSADTVEFEGGAHYNGHPRDRTIGHWIVAYAYSSSGVTLSWADSSTTVWTGVARTFAYSSSGFAQFLQSNGIAY